MKYKILPKEKKIQFVAENKVDACEIGQVFMAGVVGGVLTTPLSSSGPDNLTSVHLEITYENVWRSFMRCAYKREVKR